MGFAETDLLKLAGGVKFPLTRLSTICPQLQRISACSAFAVKLTISLQLATGP